MENSTDICRVCNARIEPGSKFCTECGEPVEEKKKETLEEAHQENEINPSTLYCPKCNAELTPEVRFCTECGAKIEGDTEGGIEENIDPITTCPKCNATIVAGTKFCTECGTNVYEYKSNKTVTTVQTGHTQTEISGNVATPGKTSKSRNDPVDDLMGTGQDLMKDVEETGKGLMKDIGSFLGKSSQSSSKKTIKPKKKEQHFLVCDKCGGYYELQKGESPDDFSQECDCGGHLKYTTKHQ